MADLVKMDGVVAGEDRVNNNDPGRSWRALRADVPSALLALTLLAMPLYRSRIFEDSFNTPKLALAMLMGVLTAIGLLARPVSFRMKLRWYPVPWLVVGLALWQAVSVLWSDSKPLGGDGTVYFATFAVLCWLFYRGPRSVDAIRGIFTAGAVGAVLTAVWVLLDDFMRGMGPLVARLPDWRGHLAAGLGNSGHIAGMVGMFLPWVLLAFLCGKTWRRWLLVPVLGVMFAALAVTWSVGSTGATAISLAIWAVVAWRWMRPGSLRWKRMAAVVGVGLLVVGFYFTPNPANPHRPSLWKEAFGSERWEAGWPTRLVIWETTWQLIKQSPMVGIGTGNFTYGYTQQVVPSVTENPKLRPYSGAFTNDAHNDYLQLWAEGGVVALGLWIVVLSSFLVTTGRLLKARPDDDTAAVLVAAGAGMTVFALDGLMSFPMRLPAHFTMAMFFLAVPGVVQRLQGQRPAPAPNGRRLRTGGVGILLTLAACVWHHGHRVMAEYYLKSGRGMADSSAVVMQGGQVTTPWAMCDITYRQVLEAVAAGAPETTWRPMLEQMERLSTDSSMLAAGGLFERALEVDRWYANASSRLGQLRLFQGEYDECLEISRRTLRTLQAYEIHERMGAAAFFDGDMKRAQEHWSTCLTRRPEMAEFYSALMERTKE